MSRPTRTPSAMFALAAAMALSGARAEDLPQGAPLAVEALALIPVDAESGVTILGLAGQITVISHPERDVRIVSTFASPKQGEAPVGVWQLGSRFVIAPPAGDTTERRALRVEVPEHFAVRVDAQDSDVMLGSLSGSVDLTGTRLRVVAQAVTGELDADLTDGSIDSREGGDLSLRLHGTSLNVTDGHGDARIRASGGTLTLAKMEGAIDIEADAAAITTTGVAGMVHVKTRGGNVKMAGLVLGAEMELSGTPLHLKDGTGDITVTSDTSVEFATMAAAMHFDMYGGSLRGKGNQGILEVRLRNSEVNVEGIDQGMRIQGDGLKARIVGVGGELYIETSVSDFILDQVGAVELHLDRGSATIQHASGPVQATVIGGDVHIIDARAAVVLDLDGGDAEVSWASLGGDKDSQLVNKSGNITARFPRGGSCRIEAKSKYGRVDSSLPTVKVLDDLSEAQGPLNNGYRPTVRIVANGDIHILDASTPQPEE